MRDRAERDPGRDVADGRDDERDEAETDRPAFGSPVAEYAAKGRPDVRAAAIPHDPADLLASILGDEIVVRVGEGAAPSEGHGARLLKPAGGIHQSKAHGQRQHCHDDAESFSHVLNLGGRRGELRNLITFKGRPCLKFWNPRDIVSIKTHRLTQVVPETRKL